jgi:thioesterase domain-containing protein
MARRLKRKGRTVTFSVSVDPNTRKLLRDVADRAYRGNVSELITQIAEQAARQEAAATLLRLHGRPSMSDEECEAFEREIAAELTRSGKKRKHRAA